MFRIFEFVACRRRRAKSHAGAGVDPDEDAAIRLGLKLLDVRPVPAGGGPPVDQTRVVAGSVIAVFGELERKAALAAAPAAACQALDDAAGAKRQPSQFVSDGWIEVGRRRAHGVDLSTSLAAINRSASASGVTPSASA